MYDNRKAQVLRQSPGLVAVTDRPGPSYKTQLNALVNKKEEPELYRALAAEPGDHAHHKIILETLDRLFDGLSKDDQAVLRDHIANTQYFEYQGEGKKPVPFKVAIGNNIRNLINMPGEIHQGGIHKFARERGYEIDAKNEPIGLARDILEASTVPNVNYRKHVADKYITEAVPEMNNYINDLLTDYYNNKGRMAGDAIRQLSGRDMSELTTGNISGDKPIIVNADEGANVFVHTNGKNGNGHADMQKTFGTTNRRLRS